MRSRRWPIGLAIAGIALGCEAYRDEGGQAPDGEAFAVAVAGGPFFAGCNEAIDDACFPDEKPGGMREVEAFAIDRTEVTVAAYRACVDAGACSPPDAGEDCNDLRPERDRHPVNCVDQGQAATYCAWRGGRLPSEWEWERAARGTQGRLHPWGDAPADCDRAVIDAGTGQTCGEAEGTLEVGRRPAGASPEGALDLIGNVWEWTSSSPENSSARVVRGGAYYVGPAQARASARLLFKPWGRGPYVGFRCARSAEEKAVGAGGEAGASANAQADPDPGA
ncbi:MAG: SUMF1/EgtB/PvdO family nonheme iron enzyme [Myxococcota bacterium]